MSPALDEHFVRSATQRIHAWAVRRSADGKAITDAHLRSYINAGWPELSNAEVDQLFDAFRAE